MSLYRQRVFPWLVDHVMATEAFSRIRRELLSGIEGDTLEIGFGTGLNLEHYPAALGRLTAVDVNPGMRARALERVSAARHRVDFRTLDGTRLPFADASFDCAVSTWTLCSIGAVEAALAEMRRVLRPHGRFFFVEHGRSPDMNVRRMQNWLTPLQARIADGCHLNRDIDALVGRANLSVNDIHRFYMDGVPRVAGFLYRGVAVKSPEVSGRQPS